MNAVTADPSTADVVTQESTTSTSYTDLTTSGPAVTLTLTNGQSCLVCVQALQWNTLQNWSYMSFAVSGATTLSAADANGALTHAEVNYRGSSSRWTVFTATAAGSHTFTAKYKCDSAGSAVFSNRRLIVKKF
jgi:hypothetical protein